MSAPVGRDGALPVTLYRDLRRSHKGFTPAFVEPSLKNLG
jgi:hypothetical protein